MYKQICHANNLELTISIDIGGLHTCKYCQEQRSGGCSQFAASCQTSGALLAVTGLIDSLLPRAIKDLIADKIGPIENEHAKKIDMNKNIIKAKQTVAYVQMSVCV